MDGAAMQTRVIYNNNNPAWNKVLDFGFVKLSLASELKFAVYDEDKTWYKSWNDLLGECSVRLGSHNNMCPMNHGTLYFSYKVDCATGLGGSTCGEYVPSGMNSDLSNLYTSRNSLNMTQDLLAHIRMGRPLGDPLAFVVKQKANGHGKNTWISHRMWGIMVTLVSLLSVSCDQNRYAMHYKPYPGLSNFKAYDF